MTPVPAQARILIVADQAADVRLLERLLERFGYRNVTGMTDAAQVVGWCEAEPPDLLLLDLQMPDPDGRQVMRRLEPLTLGATRLPMLALTTDATPDIKRQALAAGARDFLTKPFDEIEVRLRVANLLEAHALRLEHQQHRAMLEQQVRERTAVLECARMETLERLVLAGEFRDDDTHEHAGRVGQTAGLLAHRLRRPPEEVELVTRAAPLHDLGKIGISDDILLKPGRLTPDEFEVMKTHARIGAQILEGSSSAVLEMSATIAATHHERWDGQGYPDGLSGERIPLVGRITAMADVFDALTHDRPYKAAWPVQDAVTEIRRLDGLHFDPAVVAAFESLDHRALVSGTHDSAPLPSRPAAMNS